MMHHPDIPPNSKRFYDGWFLNDELVHQEYTIDCILDPIAKENAAGVAIMEWEDEIDRLYEEEWALYNKLCYEKREPYPIVYEDLLEQLAKEDPEWKAIENIRKQRSYAHGMVRAWKDWRKNRYDPNFKYGIH